MTLIALAPAPAPEAPPPLDAPHCTQLASLVAMQAVSPTVLNTRSLAKLAVLNGAIRHLRLLGLRVTHVLPDGAFPMEGEPWVRIHVDCETRLGSLLDEAGPRVYWTRQLDGRRTTTALCRYQGVVVAWEPV